MNILSHLLFWFLKSWVWITLQLFYRNIRVHHSDLRVRQGAVILASNHPNTLMDVVLSAIYSGRKVHFLANAGLFRTAFNRWFFTLVFCIPIERRQDRSEQAGLQNKSSFDQCIAFLLRGGCLYIAPEGSSWVERHLRPLKSGAARIALLTEQATDFQTGIKILPLSINYTDQRAFQSEVDLAFSPPIALADYKEEAQDHLRQAAVKITRSMQKGLLQQFIHTQEPLEDAIQAILSEILFLEKNIPPNERLQQSRQLLLRLQEWRASHPVDFRTLFELAMQYGHQRRQWHLAEEHLQGPLRLPEWALLLIGAPFFAYAWLNHAFLLALMFFVNRRFNNDPTYDSTFKFLTLLASWPIVYLLQGLLVQSWLPFPFSGWGYALSLYPLALIGLSYYHFARKIAGRWRAQRLQKRVPGAWAELLARRRALMAFVSNQAIFPKN